MGQRNNLYEKMKQISILVLTLLSIVKINSQTIPCYPACDCQGTYYDWDFDGECTSADQQLHSTMFSGNWIPSWENQDQPIDIWNTPIHPQVNDVTQINQFMNSDWCDSVDVCISIDISGSITGYSQRDNTAMQSRVILRQLLYSLYPGIIEGKIRISFTAWADYPGDFTPVSDDHIIYRLPQQLEGDLHFEWLMGLVELMFYDGNVLGNSEAFIPDAFDLKTGLGGLIPSGAGSLQLPGKGLEAAYRALNQPQYYDSNRDQFIILLTDAKWPYSYMADANTIATAIESGNYQGSGGAQSNVPADILGIIIRGGDNGFDSQDDYLHMKELTGESDGSDVAHLQNEIPYNPAPLPEPEVRSTDGYINGLGDSQPNQPAVIAYMQQITNVAENIAAAADGSCCENTIAYNNYVYPTTQIGNRCWFTEDLRYDVLTSTTDPETWINGNETPMQTYEPTLNSDVFNYNWYAVNQLDLCPTGWHVSDNLDWNNLESTLFNARPHKLTKQSRIGTYNLDTLVSNQFITEPFTVGLRENKKGLWRESETSIYWWTAEEYNPKPLELNRQRAAWARGINGSAYIITRDLWSTSNNKNNALRVRCVKIIN